MFLKVKSINNEEMNNPSFFVIGDLHIHITNLDETQLLREFLVKTAKDRRGDYDCIVLLGDILDTHNIVRTEAHVAASELIDLLSEIAPLVVIMGNHDVQGPLSFFSKYHAFTQLKKWPGTKSDCVSFPSGNGLQLVDTKPVVFTVRGIPFCALPYIPVGRFQEALSLDQESLHARAIFCHQEFQGCDLGFGRESDVSDTSSQTWISGHIHQHQLRKNGLYVGTPRQVAITEDYFKTISIIKFEESIFHEERISTNLPPRCHIKAATSEIGLINVPEYGRVKIELSGTPPENAVAKKNPLIRVWKKKGFVVKFHPLVGIKSQENAEVILRRKGLGFSKLCEISAAEEGLSHIYQEIFH